MDGMSRAEERNVVPLRGTPLTAEVGEGKKEMFAKKYIKEKMRNIYTEMDSNARKTGAFYNRNSGMYVADTKAIRKDYVKSPAKYDLPLNVRYALGKFSFTNEKATITLNFTRTKKNEDYIVRAHSTTKSKTFRYANEEELRDKITAYLNRLNINYDPSLQYDSPEDASSEWWLDKALQVRSEFQDNYSSNRGGFARDFTDPFSDYSQGGLNMLPDTDDEEEDFEPPFNLTNPFGSYKIKYAGLNIYDGEYNINEDRCGWDYLMRVMDFEEEKLKELKGNDDDFWNFEELKKVALHYRRMLIVYDLQGEQLRHYTSPTAFDDTYFTHTPNKAKHRKQMVFTFANSHIYPYRPKTQTALLKTTKEKEKKFDAIDSNGEVINTKKIISEHGVNRMKSAKGKEKAQEELDAYREDHADTMCYKEGEFGLAEYKKYKYSYLEDEDLRPLLLGLMDAGMEVPLITSKDGIITSLYNHFWCDTDKRFKYEWCIHSCPNMRVAKPIVEKLGFIYTGQDITAIGRMIYTICLGHDYNKLCSTTLGSIFKPEKPFNASTKVCNELEEQSHYGQANRDYYNYERLDLVCKQIALSNTALQTRLNEEEQVRWEKYKEQILAFKAEASQLNIPQGLAPPYEQYGDTPTQDPSCPAYEDLGEVELPYDAVREEGIQLGLIDSTGAVVEGMEQEHMEWLMEESEPSRVELERTDAIEELTYLNDAEDAEIESIDLSHIGEWVALDIRKCYTNCLEEPYNPFCRYEVFDNIVEIKRTKDFKNENGWYYVEHIQEEHEFFPFVGYRNGWFCLKVIQLALEKKIDFVITHKLLPHKANVIKKEHFKAFVDFTYTELSNVCCCSKGCEGGCAPKFVVNAFIGQLGMFAKESTYSRSFVVNTTADERYYKLKGLDTYIIRGGDNPIFLMVESKDRDYRTDCLSIHSQILQEAKCRLLELNDCVKYSCRKEVVYERQLGEIMSYINWKFTKGRKCPFQDEENLKKTYNMYKSSLIKKEVKIEEKVLCAPLRYKTDSILLADFGSGMLNEAIKNVPFSSKRGGIREEGRGNGSTYCSTLADMLYKRYTIYPQDREVSSNQTNANKYFKSNKYTDLIDKGKGFRLDGMAGTGKSSLTCGGHGQVGIIPYIESLNKTYALTATTNKARANTLFVEKGYMGQTIHSFLKIGFGREAGGKYEMCEGLDFLIIDECSMINKQIYLHLRNIKVLYPNIGIILIGDYQQIPAVENNRGKDFAIYTNIVDTQLIKWLCDFNIIHLTENKRSSEEGVKMFNLYNKVIATDYSNTNGKRFRKYPKELKEFMGGAKFNPWTDFKGINICNRNATKDCINFLIVHKIAPKWGMGDKQHDCEPFENAEGQRLKSKYVEKIWVKRAEGEMTCRVVADKGTDLYYNNQEFAIINIDTDKEDWGITLCDTITHDEVEITRTMLYKHFDYAYAMTIHRSQGSSFDSDYTINDYDTLKRDSAGNKILYVALSRTTNSKFIQINQFGGVGWESRIPLKLDKSGGRSFDRELMRKTLKEGRWFPKKK